MRETKNRIRPLIQGRETAHVLRAVFHDSVGGSDGCLNRGVDENSGFEGEDNFIRIIDDLDVIYDEEVVDTGLSRADFYVLAGEVAVENAFVNAEIRNGTCTDFQDCRRMFKKVRIKKKVHGRGRNPSIADITSLFFF